MNDLQEIGVVYLGAEVDCNYFCALCVMVLVLFFPAKWSAKRIVK